MRLVDAEITQEDEDVPDIARPPRPARRRVYTSLLVTLSVLVGTVAIIYTVFPNRQNAILTAVVEAHKSLDIQELVEPSDTELRAWSIGVLGDSVPWPKVGASATVKFATTLRIFKRNMAVARYELGGSDVTIAFLRARDAPPRKHRRSEEGLYAVSWRRGRFTCIAVGPESAKATWAPLAEAPL